ncbi:MAG: hypothetical protein IK024_08435 [Treponema sp.]|nr:hypothetical protein [Treponema sp.]
MERRKFPLLFLILAALTVTNLSAEEQSKFDKFLEAIFPFPILSLESGNPEVFSFDIGVETLFIPLGEEDRAGTYFCYNYSRSKYDNFHRFSGGIAWGMMGLFEVRGGMGYGLMPKNNEVLHTLFTEISFRILLLEIKSVFERPLKPDNLADYYLNTYEDGVKFKIGLSI